MPDIFLRVELGAVGGQAQESDVLRNNEPASGPVPACAVDNDNGMGVFGHMAGDLRKMAVHGVCVRLGQNKSYAGIARRTNGAKDVGAFISLVERYAWP